MAPKLSTAAPRKRKSPASWGTVRRRESGKFEALYRFEGRTIRAPHRFDTEPEALAWLATERAAHATGTWIDPAGLSLAPATSREVLTLASTFEALCEALIAEEERFAEARPAYLHEQARLIRRVACRHADPAPVRHGAICRGGRAPRARPCASAATDPSCRAAAHGSRPSRK